MGRGRPKGSRNKKSLAADALLTQYAESIVKKCIGMALLGDPTAMRLCMARLGAPKRETPVKLKMKPVQTLEEVKQVLAATIEAVGAGHITPGQAESLARLLDAQRRGIETVELEARLEKLEDLTSS
jgi:hypothetical protein